MLDQFTSYDTINTQNLKNMLFLYSTERMRHFCWTVGTLGHGRENA